MFSIQGWKRKFVYVVFYEGIALVLTALLLAVLSGDGVSTLTGALAVAVSVIALLWNLIFNILFEAWESRQAKRGRGLGRRLAHAVGFELGLLVWLLPLMAWAFESSLWEAFMMNVTLMVFFLVYTFTYNWSFDRLFDLPSSASEARCH